jgi:uncharacterized membrane protein YeaQ/YmgE (transglycosylase-associated protein family)
VYRAGANWREIRGFGPGFAAGVRVASPATSFEGGWSMLGILGWIVFGLIAGFVAKLLMPGRDPGGFIVTILLGVAGALLGGFIGQALGLYREGEPAGFLMSVVGAILLLVLYRMFMRPKRVV